MGKNIAKKFDTVRHVKSTIVVKYTSLGWVGFLKISATLLRAVSLDIILTPSER